MEKVAMVHNFSLNFRDPSYHFALQIDTDCKDFMVEEEASRNYWNLELHIDWGSPEISLVHIPSFKIVGTVIQIMEGINFKIHRQEATGKVNWMVEEVDIKIDSTEDIPMKVHTQIEEVDLSFGIHK